MEIIVACAFNNEGMFEKLKNFSIKLYNEALVGTTSHGGDVAVFSSKSVSVVRGGDGAQVLVSGYHSATSQELLGVISNALDTAPNPLNEQVSIGGVHTIIAQRDNQLVAWPSIPASGTLYYAMTDAGLVICNRPKLLACLINSDIDQKYISYMITTGYPIDDTTPYVGVKSLLAGHALHAQNGQFHIVRRRLASVGVVPRTPEAALEAERVFQRELIRACGAVSRFKNVELRLSGGKDSRLIISALSAGNQKVICHARGTGEDADIARDIADKLGFEFTNTVSEPLDAKLFETGVRKSLILSDGLVETEAHVGLTIPFRIIEEQDGIIYGHSHLQKGGFARTMANTNREVALDTLKKAVVPEYIEHEERKKLLGELDSVIGMFEYKASIDILYMTYAVLRAGRYLEPLYLKTATAYTPIYPLNDERMYVACSRLSRDERTNERAIYKAINDNAPILKGLALCEDKWRFEPKEMLPAAKLSEENYATESTPSEFQKMVRMARNGIRGSQIVNMAIELLDPEIIGRCGLGAATGSKKYKFLSRHSAKLIMRLYFAKVLFETWQMERPSSSGSVAQIS